MDTPLQSSSSDAVPALISQKLNNRPRIIHSTSESTPVSAGSAPREPHGINRCPSTPRAATASDNPQRKRLQQLVEKTPSGSDHTPAIVVRPGQRDRRQSPMADPTAPQFQESNNTIPGRAQSQETPASHFTTGVNRTPNRQLVPSNRHYLGASNPHLATSGSGTVRNLDPLHGCAPQIPRDVNGALVARNSQLTRAADSISPKPAHFEVSRLQILNNGGGFAQQSSQTNTPPLQSMSFVAQIPSHLFCDQQHHRNFDDSPRNRKIPRDIFPIDDIPRNDEVPPKSKTLLPCKLYNGLKS